MKTQAVDLIEVKESVCKNEGCYAVPDEIIECSSGFCGRCCYKDHHHIFD